MGNKNLKNISITNFPINKDNNFIKTPTDIEKLKEGMKEEKKNLKTISKQNKSLKDYTLLENCLKNHPILYFLDKNAMKEIIQQMSQYESNENLEIFTQGATPWFFLILSEGTCDLYYNGEKFDTKESGECLDDLSLIYDCNRIYTVKTSTKCKFWGLGRKNFKKILELINNVTFDEKYNKTSSLALFSFNDKNIKNKIIYNLNKEKRNAGNQIIKREHITNCLYYIEQGQVDIKFDDYVIDTLHEGDYFGELSIFFNTNRIFDYVAKDNCFIYSLPIGHMNNISDNYRMEILFSLLKAAFLKVEKFKNINHKFFNEIFDLFEFQYFGKEQIILQKEFLISSYIIIPIEGCLFLEEERSLICKRGDLLFGEYLFDLNKSPINYNIKCKLHSLLLLADTNQVLQRIGCTFKDYIEKYSPINQLKQVKLFKNLTTEKINEIFEKIKIKKI